MRGLNQILCRIKHVTIAPYNRLCIDQHVNYIPPDINCVRLLSQQETVYVADKIDFREYANIFS